MTVTSLLLALCLGCGGAHGRSAGKGHSPNAVDRTEDGWKRAGRASSKKAPKTKSKKVAALRKTPDLGARVVANGRAILAGKAKKPARQDCSGFVTAIYARAGHELVVPPRYTKGTKSLSEMLYRWAKDEGRTHRKRPRPGDIAFFRDTYGRINGRITHIAVVESVGEDGSVTLIHHMGGRYRRSPMHLGDPHEPLKNGFFRKRGSANEPVLAGELFVAYARPH